MREMVTGAWCILVCFSSFAFSGSATETDSVPSAITVYRNPEFFRNLTRGREKEDSDEEEDKEGFNSNDSEEFQDFEDEYRYPGEPKKPNPPHGPDFTTYYDESPEFVPEPRDVSPSSRYEEDDEDENEEQEEERESESSKYDVPLEKGLQLRVQPKLYEESHQYYNPFFKTGMESFSYPSSYKDLDYYPKTFKNEKLTDNKKGTREYLRDHSAEEVAEEEEVETHLPSRADSKHVFRAASKFGFKAYSPVFYVPHTLPKIKYKVLYRPKKFRGIREIPNDSAYQLSSDYDSDFEFV